MYININNNYHNNNNNSIKDKGQCLQSSHHSTAVAKVHSVNLMNVEQCTKMAPTFRP